MKNYLNLVSRVINNGVYRDDRTGTGTWSVFGEQERFRLDNGFPLLTTKKLHLRSIIMNYFGLLKEIPMLSTYRKTRLEFGMSGLMKMGI